MENPFVHLLPQPAGGMEGDTTPAVPQQTQEENPFAHLLEEAQTSAPAVAQRSAPLPEPENPFSHLMQQAPEVTQRPASVNDDATSPGFAQTLVAAGGKGMQEAGQEVSDLWTGIKAKLSGQPFFTPAPEGHEVSSEADAVLKTPISEGWSSPKWWGAKMVYGAAKTLPALAAGIPGAMAGGAVGGGAAMGGTQFATQLLPQYRAALAAQQAQGLPIDEDAAITMAIKAAGIDGITMGVMGGVGMTPLLGVDAVTQAIKYPIKEALVQMGVLQPAIAAVGQIAGSGAQNRIPSIEEVGEGVAMNLAMGGIVVGSHLAMSPKAGSTPVRPATVEKAFETQRPVEPAVPSEAPIPSEVPRAAVFDEASREVERGVFFSSVQRHIETNPQPSASGSQWLSTLRNAPGVKPEELDYMNLPQWLEGNDGKIPKSDLLAHIEANQLKLEEVNLDRNAFPDEAEIVAMAKRNLKVNNLDWETQSKWMRGVAVEEARSQAKEKRTQYEEYTLPGPRENYGELLLKLPGGDRVTRLNQEHEGLLREFDQPGVAGTPRGREIINRMEAINEERANPTQPSFRAPHFSTMGGLEENILAHARYTSRYDRDGKRTLFIEEVQSDWHQAGREWGYTNEYKPPVIESVVQIRSGPGQFANAWRITFDNGHEREVSGAWNREEAIEHVLTQAEYKRRDVPGAPFKTSWPELVFKRMLAYAADNGFERIAWTNGSMQEARYPGLRPDQVAGMKEFYDRILPKIAQKWGKKLGMESGETVIPGRKGIRDLLPDNPFSQVKLMPDTMSRSVRSLDVSPAAGERIQLGLPLFDKEVPGVVRQAIQGDTPPGLLSGVNQAIGVIKKLETAFKMPEWMGHLNFKVINDPNKPQNGRYFGYGAHEDKISAAPEIQINVARMRTVERVYATLAHEFGHHLQHYKFDKLADHEKLAINNAYLEFRQALGADATMGALLRERDQGIKQLYRDSVVSDTWANTRLLDMTADQRAYWAGFSEWFAESVAKWATTSEKPLSFVEKFFSSLGKSIRGMIETVTKKFGRSFEPHRAMKEWLDSNLSEDFVLGPDQIAQAQLRTKQQNAEAMNRAGAPETPSVSQEPSTQNGRQVVEQNPLARDKGREMAAHADRMNAFYKWMYSLQQLAKINPQIPMLQRYREMVDFFHVEKNAVLNEAHQTVRYAQKNVRGEQKRALMGFIDDYRNGRFLPEDVKVLRRPTKDEFEKMVAKWGLTEGSLETFKRMTGDFDRMLDRYREVMVRETTRINDPLIQAQRLDEIDKQILALRSKPYMPNLRFGDLTLTHYDAAGKIKGFYTFESARMRESAKNEIKVEQGEKLLPGALAPDVKPLLGMPPGLLDLMGEKLNLSSTQKAALDQLKFEYAPAQSFRHRFQNKENTPGYSDDWLRSYSNYMFHGANHFARVKWIDQMRDQIAAMRQHEFRMTREDATNLDQIRAFMANHLDTIMDPKPDWGLLRGLAFHMFLGFNPVSAAVNLSQTPLMSYPFLASKFGDGSAIGALTRSGIDMSNFYRKETFDKNAVGKEKAFAQAVSEGVISETQAHALAALSEGGFMGHPGWQKFSEMSAKMFEMTEQWNRRLIFSSAFDLAGKNLGSKYVKDILVQEQAHYESLVRSGWSGQDAASYLVAKDATNWTQFQYGRESRPRLFQGRKSALFIFKSFMTNSLINSWISGPSQAVRSMLVLGALGGAMGLPFSEDIKNVVKGIGKLFDRDWDLEDAVRRYVVDVTNGKIGPDLLLHGVSRYAFGLPQVADLFGAQSGGRGRYDVSKNLSMGNVVPGLRELAQVTKDPQAQELRALQQAAGPAGGYAFNFYKFLTSSPLADPEWKKFELIMPRVLANASAAFRWGTEGVERSKTGASVLKFDISDPFQAAEVIGKALGFNPTSLSARWDLISAQREAEAFHDIQRQLLLKRFAEAVRVKDQDGVGEIKKEIVQFNRSLPLEARGKAITADTVRQSVMNREVARRKQELGLPLSPKSLPIYQDLQRLYPEGVPDSVVGVRRVR